LASELERTRLNAAAASRGTSADPIYRAILARIDALDARGRVLDFGAGTGHLAQRLVESGRFETVDAADIVDYGAEPAVGVHWIFSDLNERLPVAEGTYDLVVAAEVIEHLENPRFLAREWFRILRPGGVVLVSTPNNESWRSLISLLARGHYTAFTGDNYPAHINAFLRKDLERILTEAGFRDVDLAFTDSGAVPKLTSRSWQDVSFGKLRGVRYSDNVVCTARKPA
jgi:2-polyprenyl-3-methyl-5-hydroxy-6-metoxy-1,4-benzoquinol methylase